MVIILRENSEGGFAALHAVHSSDSAAPGPRDATREAGGAEEAVATPFCSGSGAGSGAGSLAPLAQSRQRAASSPPALCCASAFFTWLFENAWALSRLRRHWLHMKSPADCCQSLPLSATSGRKVSMQKEHSHAFAVRRGLRWHASTDSNRRRARQLDRPQLQRVRRGVSGGVRV